MYNEDQLSETHSNKLCTEGIWASYTAKQSWVIVGLIQ